MLNKNLVSMSVQKQMQEGEILKFLISAELQKVYEQSGYA
jgi:hypothetical protein